MKLLIALIFVITSQLTVAGDIDSFFSKTDSFLKKYVKKGNVDYKKIKINKTEIELLYKEIGEVTLKGSDANLMKAFYANAYNLIVINSIVEKYPVKSPMDIGGFFDKKKYNVAGEPLTLNELEKEKLLLPYKDARFHFALVCAAKSCPSLSNEAFTPANTENQLTARTTKTVNDASWLKVNSTSGKVELSKIFEWYNGDFTPNGSSIIDWINKFKTVKIPKSNKVSHYEYDWTLNE